MVTEWCSHHSLTGSARLPNPSDSDAPHAAREISPGMFWCATIP